MKPETALLTCAIVVVLLVMAASAGWAQEAEDEGPDPFERDLLKYRSFFDYGGFEPDLETLLPQGYFSRWYLNAGVDATYSDNVDQEQEDRKDAFWSYGTLGVGWLRQSPRLQGTLDYRLSVPIYQSEHADDRDSIFHRAAGALQWQAARYLTLNAGGHIAQDLEGGLDRLPGVRTTYDNRSDEYGVDAGYSWRGSRVFSSDASYAFKYRNFVSGDAEGEDSRIQSGSARLGVQPSDVDRFDLRYWFRDEDEIDTDVSRTNHRGAASWSHTFLNFPTLYHRSTLRLSYDVERDLPSDGENFWSHRGSGQMMFGLTEKLSAGITGGYEVILREDEGNIRIWDVGGDLNYRFSDHTYASAGASYEVVDDSDKNDKDQYINARASLEHAFSERTDGSVRFWQSLEYLPERGDVERSTNFEANLNHRFSPRTTGSLTGSRTWEYEPSSTRSDVTVFTQIWKAAASLNSQLARHLTGQLTATYEDAEPDEGNGDEDYWQAGGIASLSGRVGEKGFWGSSYRLLRRQTDGSDEDYLLQIASVFYRRQILEWLLGSVRYTHERRNHDSGSDEEDYHENRVYGSLTATW